MADWLIQGLTATISGVLTVFIVLILIAFLISQLKHLNKLETWKNRNSQTRNTIESTSTAVVASVETVHDDLELVAVITAAVASSLNTTTDKLIVRSIKRVENKGRRR